MKKLYGTPGKNSGSQYGVWKFRAGWAFAFLPLGTLNKNKDKDKDKNNSNKTLASCQLSLARSLRVDKFCLCSSNFLSASLLPQSHKKMKHQRKQTWEESQQ